MSVAAIAGAARQLNGKEGFIRQETTGVFVSPINGTFVDMLWTAAGTSSPPGALLVIVFEMAYMIWPVMFLVTHKLFEIRGVRSDNMAYYVFGLFFPVWILASGALEGRDAFVWIKLISLAAGSMALNAIKYHLPPPNRLLRGNIRMSLVYSQLAHGILIVNIGEAVLWELTQLQGEPYNYINALSGALQMILIIAYARRYGFGVLDRRGETERQVRANLTPIYIIAYTVWNIAYNAVYHPDKTAYYIGVTLVVPFFAAFLGHIDWLEVRAMTLVHGLCLRNMPIEFSGPIKATLFLYEDTFRSEAFRYTFSVLSAVTTLLALLEVLFLINTGRKHHQLWGLGRNIDVDERHPEKYYRDGDDPSMDAVVMASDV